MRNLSLLKRRGLVNHSVYITGTRYKYRKGYRYKKLLIFFFPYTHEVSETSCQVLRVISQWSDRAVDVSRIKRRPLEFKVD